MNTNFYTNYSELTFLEKIKDSLRKCKSFSFSVSFIKYAGLVLLKDDIEKALNRGVNGRIITSTYQNFTDIESLKMFHSWMNTYENFSCNLDFNSFGDKGFHSKGYLFEFDNNKEIVIGSSNITRYALLHNIEWDVSIKSNDEKSIDDAFVEFDFLWNKTEKLSLDLIEKYTLNLDYSIEKWDMDYIQSYTTIKPNLMQRKALKELRRYRDMGVKKSLCICATGSGKTYLAAFDARNLDAKRVLFVVHRENILIEARKAFLNVFGDKYICGIYTGNKKELNADFLFTTNVTMAQNLSLFDKNEFDYIVLDECQYVGRYETYQNGKNIAK